MSFGFPKFNRPPRPPQEDEDILVLEIPAEDASKIVEEAMSSNQSEAHKEKPTVKEENLSDITSHLVELASRGDVTKMEGILTSEVQSWLDYATDHDEFNSKGSPQKALWKANLEARTLAEAVASGPDKERIEKTLELAQKLDEIQNVHIEAIKKAVTEHEKNLEPKIEEAPIAPPTTASIESLHIPNDKPAAISIEKLSTMAAKGIVEDIDGILDLRVQSWFNYATNHNVFVIKGDPKSALWKANGSAQEILKAIADTTGEARAEKVVEFTKKLEEMAEYTAAIEQAVKENDARLERSKDGTAKETSKEVARLKQEALEQFGDNANLELPQALNIHQKNQETESNTTTRERKLGRNEKVSRVEVSVAEEREAMDDAEKAYLFAYKDFYRQKGAKEKNEPADLKDLKSAFDETRIAYANTLTENAEKRLQDRGMKPGVYREGERMHRYNEKDVLARYNRLVRFNEIVKPAAENRYEAKLQALGEREKGLFAKGFAKYAEFNKKLEQKFGKNGARVARIAATTIAGTAALGVFGSAGIFAALGYGSFKFARSLGSSFAGAAAGKASAKLYERFFGRKSQQEAKDDLAYEGRDSHELSAALLDMYDDNRAPLLKKADERTLNRKKAWIHALSAMGVGAGVNSFATLLSEMPSGVEGAHDLVQHNTPPQGAPLTPSAPNPLTTLNPKNINLVAGATIHHHAEGTNELFNEMKARITENGAFKGSESPALKHFMQSQPTALSREMGTSFGTKGFNTQMGDKFFVDEHQNIWFQQTGHEPQPFITNSIGGRGYEVHAVTTDHPTVAVAHEHAHPTHTHSQQRMHSPTTAPREEVATAQPDYTAELNKAELKSVLEREHAASHPDATTAVESTPSTSVETDHSAADVPPVEAEHPADSVPNATEQIITNKLGVKIDTASTHVYQLAKPKGVFVVVGGPPEDKEEIMQGFMRDPRFKGQVIYTPVIDPTTHKEVLYGNILNEDGQSESPQALVNARGKMIEFGGLDTIEGRIM